MRRHFQIVLALVAISGLTACSRATPTSPSSLGGVTINGSLVAPGSANGGGGGPMEASPPAFVPPGLTVSAVGTGVIAPVDPAGQFVLRNLPAGTVQLRFSAPGTAASLTLTGLEAGQTVAIGVSLTASSAAIESERRSGGSEDQLEGRVNALPPTTAALSLQVAGQTVTTSATTRFYLRGAPASFADLELGQRVHVKGHMSGLSLAATVVNIQNTNTGIGLNLNGVMSNFTGTAAAFEFIVNGQLVKGDALTEFFGNSQFNQLADGQTVEVKGSQRTGYVYATRIHVEAPETEFTGVIVAPITGTSPDLTFLVGATTVKTSAVTVVRRKGDVQTPAQLAVGMTVEVSGSLLPNGTVIARKIGIEADAVGGAFQMTGHVSGLSGACPTLSFSVSGYAIVTTGTTVFVPNCAAISSGTEVKVIGIVQTGGSVSATKVEKQ